jgi:hypothetical protein
MGSRIVLGMRRRKRSVASATYESLESRAHCLFDAILSVNDYCRARSMRSCREWFVVEQQRSKGGDGRDGDFDRRASLE